MKRIIIILILLSVGQHCFSQTGTVKGHVHNSDENEGLAFAIITLVNNDYKTTTDLNGNFIFDSIPVGIYDLKISYATFGDTILTSIIVTKDTLQLNINYPPHCEYDKKNNICPQCKKNDKVIPIIYGLPSKGLMKKSKKGKVKLGGCMVTYCYPNWYCKRNKKSF